MDTPAPRTDAELGLTRDMVFIPAMIDALLRRHKVATRRLFAFDPRQQAPANWDGHFHIDADAPDRHVMLRGLGLRRYLPVATWPGDKIAVKERFEVKTPWSEKTGLARIRYATNWRSSIEYVDTDGHDYPVLRTTGWKSSRFMPRCACRLSLAVTRVRVHRLDEITDSECLEEGVRRDPEGGFTAGAHGGLELRGATPRMAFAVLWDVLHGQHKGQSWRDNPYVLAIRFRVES